MRIIFQFLKPYKALFAFTLFFIIADVVGALVIPTMTAEMINTGVGSRDLAYIVQIGVVMVAVTVAAGLSALLGSYLSARLSARLGQDMRNALYRKSLTFSVDDFETYGTGSMITRTLNDVSVVQQAFVWCVQLVLPVPALAVSGILMAFSIEPSMGILLTAAVAFVIALALFVSKRASAIFERMQHFLDRMNIVLRENITGVRVIRAFNKEQHEKKRMKKSFTDYAEAAIKTNYLFAALDCLSFFIISILIVGILWFGGNQIGLGKMKIGDITALTEYTILILFYLIMAQMVIIVLPRAKVCLHRLEEILNHGTGLQDGQKEAVSNTQMQETVRFDQVAFRFADADIEMLQELSFSCLRGKTTAIIGGTGSGKSTIAKLLLRFYDVTKGTIFLNGQDVRTISAHDLRAHIAYVPQKAWLFSGTIAENLRFGKPNATKQEMLHALEVAQAEFLQDLPQGLDAHVAQGGTNFSGGQKQRLSIARALIKKADLYIFDDSFSALDFKTDSELRKALAQELKDAAILIIAQRINTILNADQIIVLHNGQIMGIGTHSELMKTCPVYQEIAKSQMKGAEINGG